MIYTSLLSFYCFVEFVAAVVGKKVYSGTLYHGS